MVVSNVLSDETDRIFQALADPTRRDILARVVRREQSVSTLAESYTMSFAAVQKHIAVLERASLVVKQRSGREQIVHGNLDAVRTASRLLQDYEKLWRLRVQSISEILAEDSGADARDANANTSTDTNMENTDKGENS
jgi:DNA-binding transcriptional ArsR family regulator